MILLMIMIYNGNYKIDIYNNNLLKSQIKDIIEEEKNKILLYDII